MGIIGFLGFVCILWGLYTLVQSTRESASQQRQILEELRHLRVLGESLNQRTIESEPIAKQPDAESEVSVVSSIKADEPSELVDINNADIQTLQTLPGVGKVLAQKIIDKRPYPSVDALEDVQGISQEFLSKLKPLVKA